MGKSLGRVKRIVGGSPEDEDLFLDF